MNTTSMHRRYRSLLTIGLSLLFCLGMIVGAEAAPKSKFRYDTPNASQWVNYCQKKHPGKTLKRCCARRHGSCQARCAKSKYPNTAYNTKTQCVSDCRNTRQQCVVKGKGEDTSKPKPKIPSLSRRAVAQYSLCGSINNVVKHNVCCDEKGYPACTSVCDAKVRHPKIQEKCYSECDKHRQGCYKKHSKRAYAKMKKRTPNPQWMKSYCSKRKNRQGKSQALCCQKMESQCQSACEGYPDTKEAISQCQDRCRDAHDICGSRK
ncbi:MAG: hypothetical protein ACPGYT_14130 [Nitrospirales bacterium]